MGLAWACAYEHKGVWLEDPSLKQSRGLSHSLALALPSLAPEVGIKDSLLTSRPK